MRTVRKIISFEWDIHNRDKNFAKHRVTDAECEEVFFDEKKKVLKDLLHSGTEKRHITIGRTKNNRVLFTAFTIRKHKIRVISARDLNKKERHLYEKES